LIPNVVLACELSTNSPPWQRRRPPRLAEKLGTDTEFARIVVDL